MQIDFFPPNVNVVLFYQWNAGLVICWRFVICNKSKILILSFPLTLLLKKKKEVKLKSQTVNYWF